MKRACSGTVPARTHRARSSPAITHPCPFIRSAPAQRSSGFTDVTITACTSLARTHTHREKRCRAQMC